MFLASIPHTWAEAPMRTTSSTSVRTAVRFDFDGTTYEWRANQAPRLGRIATTYWNYKLAARYVFPHDVGFSTAYRPQSGFQVGRRATVQLPNAGAERVMANPYDDRAPSVGIFDVRVEKHVHLRNGAGLTLLLDGFNLFNDAAVLNYRTNR